MQIAALQNLLDPAILFFFLGCAIAMVRSNLEIPPAISRFFSLYLLMAMGFKGGVALSTSPLDWTSLATLLCAMAMALIIPFWGYLYLRRRFSAFDAAAVAAAYGSVSAVTFITATQFLEREGIPFGGHMMVAMVLMESPAIVMAVFLAHHARRQIGTEKDVGTPSGTILREALTDGSQLLLLGSLVIGALVGIDGKKTMDPFTGEIFKGILAFFLLEMGLTVVRKSREFQRGFYNLIGFGLVMPLLSAALATGLLTYLILDMATHCCW
jgi:Predicted permease